MLPATGYGGTARSQLFLRLFVHQAVTPVLTVRSVVLPVELQNPEKLVATSCYYWTLTDGGTFPFVYRLCYCMEAHVRLLVYKMLGFWSVCLSVCPSRSKITVLICGSTSPQITPLGTLRFLLRPPCSQPRRTQVIPPGIKGYSAQNPEK